MIPFLDPVSRVFRCFYGSSPAPAGPWATTKVKPVRLNNAYGMYDDCGSKCTNANDLINIINTKSRALIHHLKKKINQRLHYYRCMPRYCATMLIRYSLNHFNHRQYD